jgi:MFS transporter, ACS family, allantoate permease
MPFSVLGFFLLGTPHELSWLSGSERMAAARVVRNKTGSNGQKRSEWKRDQLQTTFRDPETYLLFFCECGKYDMSSGTTTFENLVYKSFGFTSLDTLQEGRVPQQAVSVVCFLFVGYCTLTRLNLRYRYPITPSS